MRRTVVLFLAAAALTAVTGPLSAQGPVPDDKAWRLKGLRTAVCTVSTASKQSRDGLQAANSGCSCTTPRNERWSSAASEARTGR